MNYFSWICDEDKRIWLEDFYDAIDICDGWPILKKYKSDSPEMNQILNDINISIQVDHSDESYKWTLNEMVYIAKYGMEKWIDTQNNILL